MKRYIYSTACSLGAALLLGSAAPAMAQMYYAPYAPGPDFPLHWFVDAGYSATTGQTATYLDDGWNIGGGVQWRPQPGPFSLRGDLSYSRFNGTDAPGIGPSGNPVIIDNGWTNVLNFDVDGVYDIPLGGGVKAYLMAGGGGAYTRMNFASGGFYCGPFGPCGGPSDGTTRWSWNAGAGINFPLYGGQSWFIEARYDKVETQIPGEFVPVRVGFRF